MEEKVIKLSIPGWNIEAMTGYKPKTTFWQDFSIAERISGEAGVKDTFNRAFEEWQTDHVFLTELVMVLNWKIWQHYKSNEPLARVYNDLWEKADLYAAENLTGAELEYFYQTTN